jgi:hypothetical protein
LLEVTTIVDSRGKVTIIGTGVVGSVVITDILVIVIIITHIVISWQCFVK